MCAMSEVVSLKNKRLRGDVIETFKLLTNKEDINSQQFFQDALTYRAGFLKQATPEFI